MNYFKSFSRKLEKMEPGEFEELAMDLFQFQAENNEVYRAYLKARKIKPSAVKKMEEIPFLPIRFFKSHPVVCGGKEAFSDFYSSSGTTGAITSRHYIWSRDFYLKHAERVFQQSYGELEKYHVLALLPSYLERRGSSLVDMAQYFIQQSNSSHSGFYLHDHKALLQKLKELQLDPSRKVLLLGVTFGLLDFVEEFHGEFPEMKEFTVMETGGMKGRRKEMVRAEVHSILTKAFGVDRIHSEYGMTELMSQAYSFGEGKYTLSSSMHVYIRDINDPFSWSTRRQGGINIIDLANFHSCAFIETHDLGRIDSEGQLEVLGRFDNSDVRGCNLMVN